MISTDVQFIKADRENQEKLLLNIDMLFYTISVMPDNGIQPFRVKSGYRRANNFVANFKCFSVNSVLIPFGISDISTTAKSVSSYTSS